MAEVTKRMQQTYLDRILWKGGISLIAETLCLQGNTFV